MSCSTCLNHEKQPLNCVFDEDGKSLREYLDEVHKQLKELKDVVDAPIDGKGLSGNTISELLQSVINKVATISTSNNNILDAKFVDMDNQEVSVNVLLSSILKRLSILEHRTTNPSFI